MPVTLTEVKVQVTQNRMILRLRWWLMLNNMSSCNVLAQLWVKTSLAKMILLELSTASSQDWRWFQRDGYWQVILLAADMCGSPRSRAGGMLLESTSHASYTLWITRLPTRIGEMSDHGVGCLLGWSKRSLLFLERFWHTKPRSCTMTVCAFTMLQLLDTVDLPGITALIVPPQCHQGMWKWPTSHLAPVTAYAKPSKQLRLSASGTSFSDWIGGTCQADTLQVWFSAHWAPVVQQLQKKEDWAEHPSWMDEEVAPADIPKQWQETRANRRVQFKVGNRDGSGESNIRLLTGTIKAD